MKKPTTKMNESRHETDREQERERERRGNGKSQTN